MIPSTKPDPTLVLAHAITYFHVDQKSLVNFRKDRYIVRWIDVQNVCVNEIFVGDSRTIHTMRLIFW